MRLSCWLDAGRFGGCLLVVGYVYDTLVACSSLSPNDACARVHGNAHGRAVCTVRCIIGCVNCEHCGCICLFMLVAASTGDVLRELGFMGALCNTS